MAGPSSKMNNDEESISSVEISDINMLDNEELDVNISDIDELHCESTNTIDNSVEVVYIILSLILLCFLIIFLSCLFQMYQCC